MNVFHELDTNTRLNHVKLPFLIVLRGQKWAVLYGAT